MSPPTILLPQNITEKGKNYLHDAGYAFRSTDGIDEEALCRAVGGCDAILLRTARVTRRVLEAGTNLKVVARHGVGFDNVDVEAATELGIWVTNAPLSNMESVAEHTLALILSLAHNVVFQDKALRGGNFESRNQKLGVDVAGKTLGIMGFGNIGSVVARKAAVGLDMKVIVYARTTRAATEWTEMVSDREEFFRRSDFVSLHFPGTPETRHTVGERELGWMKKSAFLINTARGEVVDESALINALEETQIAGAALDVFETEPPAKDNPLFALDNVIVTPHNAALTTESMDRMGLHAAMSIQQVLSGEQPHWPVNFPKNPRRKSN